MQSISNKEKRDLSTHLSNTKFRCKVEEEMQAKMKGGRGRNDKTKRQRNKVDYFGDYRTKLNAQRN